MIPKSSSHLGCVFSSTEVVGDDGTTTIKITMPTLANIFTHQLQFPDNEAGTTCNKNHGVFVKQRTDATCCLSGKTVLHSNTTNARNAQNAAFEQMKRRKWKKFNLLKISKPIKSPPK